MAKSPVEDVRRRWWLKIWRRPGAEDVVGPLAAEDMARSLAEAADHNQAVSAHGTGEAMFT